MTNEKTIAQAFEVAIDAEDASQRLFLGLEAKFAHHAALAAFWRQYAHEETEHAAWLSNMRARLNAAQLSQPVDAQTVRVLQTISGFSVVKALQRVRNLEDAYQLVSDMENGETNAIFKFLVDNFEKDERLRAFLRAQLIDHIARLVEGFPEQYKGSLARRAIETID
jgi:hypothetical protein